MVASDVEGMLKGHVRVTLKAIVGGARVGDSSSWGCFGVGVIGLCVGEVMLDMFGECVRVCVYLFGLDCL